MCCFSQPVEHVSDTSIFARGLNGRQFLVYSMTYAAARELAMVLPLPVPPNPPEDAVRFINLEEYPRFFDDMRQGFAAPRSTSWSEEIPAGAAPTLVVHEVGSFEASFVPTVADFDRLDERFRIPRDTWDRLPDYHDYGFAVFKLKGDEPSSLEGLSRLERLRLKFWRKPPEPPKPRAVHPMAFEFPRRNPDLLYFPTVHIHDRQVHESAAFDHMLYCQAGPGMEEYVQGWESASCAPVRFMMIDLTKGIVDPHLPCRRRSLAGILANRDTLVGKDGAVPVAIPT